MNAILHLQALHPQSAVHPLGEWSTISNYCKSLALE